MIEVIGADTLASSLARLSAALQEEPELLSELAQRVQRDAREIAPKRTGRLASSIGIRQVSRGHEVRTSLPYAQYVHYGSIHNPRPVPFLTIAARRAEAQAGPLVERRVDAAIGRAGL